MRMFTRLLVIVVVLSCSNAWSDIKSGKEIAAEAKAGVPHVSPEQFSAYLSGDENFVLLDVRTEAEYEAGHIKGARWAPRGMLEFVIQKFVEDPGSKIVLYCRTGGRSALATRTLLDMGYTDVVDIDGGFEAWVTGGNAIYNQHGELKVLDYRKKE